VQLHQVQAFDAKVVSAPVDPLAECLRRIRRQVERHSAAHLRRDEERLTAPLPEEPADQLLAVAVAVDVRRVVERHARVGGRVQRTKTRGIVDLAPAAADCPRPEADGADRAPCLAEPAVLHCPSPAGS